MDAWDMVAKQEATSGDAVSEVPGGDRVAVREVASSQGPFKSLDEPAIRDKGCFDFIYDCQVRGVMMCEGSMSALRLRLSAEAAVSAEARTTRRPSMR